MRHSESSSKRAVYSNSISSQETRKISNNLTLHLKQLEKEEGEEEEEEKEEKPQR